MKGFAWRGLEFHSSRMWQWAQVKKAMDFMESAGMNALIFHQNDIVDHLVFPMKYFPDELMWARWPVRMHSIYQNRHYINKVVREAEEKDISFFLEIKEISFVDELVEIVPGLRNAAGDICPTNPFWWDFLELKMRELLEAVPGIAGVIVSPGSRESKVSISTNSCTCERCRSTDALTWYTHLLDAMYRPLAEAGKMLSVRDFSYTASHQSMMIQAASRCSEDIVISLKNTPHDYYPTFPHNPSIGHTGGLRQWIEFDTWGQFYGLGFFPVGIVEDLQYRMRHCLAQGAEGITLRTDWEVITDASVFNSLNMLNLFAGAMLAQNVDCDLDDIYSAWVQYGLLSPMHANSELKEPIVPAGEKAAQALRKFMEASWKVMEKAVYVRGHLFHEDDQFPDTVNKAFDMMVHIHGRDDWEPGASKLVEATEENLPIIFAEKKLAVHEVRALPALLSVETLGIPESLQDELNDILDLYEYYVRGYQLCAHAVFYAKTYELFGRGSDAAAAIQSIAPLQSYRAEIIERLKGTHYPHYVYWLLDEKRIALLIQDLEKRLLKEH